MTTWYVDLALSFDGTHSRSGQEEFNAWGGPAGAARAIAAAGAGDTILLANGADPAANVPLTRLWKLPVASTAGMDAGDLLEDATRGAVARIAAVAGGDYVLVEPVEPLENPGYALGDTVTADGGATTTTIDAPPTQPGLQITGDLAADGTPGAPITLRGVGPDWTAPQAAWLDGASVCDCLTIDGLSFWRFDRLRLHRGASYGLVCIGSEAGEGCVFTAVTADLAGVNAFHRMHVMHHALMIDCEGRSATLEGMHYAPGQGALVGCRLTGNGSYGIYRAADVTCFACVMTGNGGPAVDVQGGSFVLLLHCVLDGNAVGAYVTTSATMLAMIANRLTSNDDGGARQTGTTAGLWSDYNVYWGNGGAESLNIPHGPNDHGPPGSGLPHEDVAADGYVDRPAGNFALAGDAAGRRLAFPVGATTAYLAAGPVPDDPPRHDYQVSFHHYEVTFP
ncbi:MAG: right-handed parallel beta-helix repeat-containing protein [Planctomycetes bacterium]|nr:right-handed parallel beta-helix repeat-containing protein [Planctomycetota bacterium]